MRVLIVTEGSKETGLGHVSRMQVLARALEERGVGVYAWMADGDSLGAERWRRGGGTVLCEPYWLGKSWGKVVMDVPNSAKPSILARKLAEKNKVAVVVGRLNDLPENERQSLKRTAEVVIEQNETTPRLWLIDPRFVLCQPEQRNNRALVSFGGTDPHHMTEMALATLAKNTPLRLTVTNKPVGEWPNVRQVQADSLVDEMSLASVYVGAVGMTALEACAAGLPSVLVSWTEEHLRLGRWLSAVGAAIHLGLWNTVTTGAILEAVGRVESAWPEMSAATRKITDGCGAERVAKIVSDSRSLTIA